MRERVQQVLERNRLRRAGRPRARMYLPAGADLTEFFRTLARLEVSYVVLRWFETLPEVAPDEDIDLLVADEHLDEVRGLLVNRPPAGGGQKFDVYSASGLPGSDFRGIAYYPPRFARELLDGAVLTGGLFRVPNPKHHFDSLAYHAVYHKGYAADLDDGTGRGRDRVAADHDYAEHLGKLAADLGLQVTPTLAGLDHYLRGEGLQPPLDTLERLRVGNPWITDRFFVGAQPVDPVWRGLAVFVLRDRAAHLVDTTTRHLNREGFEVLDVVELDPEQREAVSNRLRGGNWGRGPYPTSGGGPSTYVVVYDVAPAFRPDDDGTLTNHRIPRAKELLRDVLLTGVAAGEEHNPVHSSDNPRQALDYLEALGDPALLDRLHQQAAELEHSADFPYPVVRAFPTETRRAQVAVVDHPVHGPSVCKLFRPCASRFFDNELRARAELAGQPLVPELLESGDGWLLTPLYTDDGRHVVRRLPGTGNLQLRPEATRALVEFTKAIHRRGLFLLDLSAHNLISDPEAGLKLVDLEFLQRYREPVPPLARSYTFRGLPKPAPGHYDEPRPVWGALLTEEVGNTAFHPAVTGGTVEDFLRAERPGDDLRRRLVQDVWFVHLLWRKHYGLGRRRLAMSRWGRRARTARWLLLGRGSRP